MDDEKEKAIKILQEYCKSQKCDINCKYYYYDELCGIHNPMGWREENETNKYAKTIKELKAGEYIRARNGIFFKLNKVIRDHLIDEKGLNSCFIDDMVKHSSNIIDLLEVGDYINGDKVNEITKNYITIDKITYGIKDLKDINDVVTHEQFEERKFYV